MDLNKKSGFTLLELLISFTIISLIAAIGLPIFSSIKKNIALDNQKQQLVNDLRLTQRLAIVSDNGTNHGIHFNTDNYIIFGGNWAAPIHPHTRQLSNGIQITQGAGSEVIFNRLTGDSTNQQIKISLPDGKEKIIIISAIGGIFSL